MNRKKTGRKRQKERLIIQITTSQFKLSVHPNITSGN